MRRYADCPLVLRDFLIYHETIKGQSPLTIDEYYLDLRMFLRFMKLMRNDMPIQTHLTKSTLRRLTLISSERSQPRIYSIFCHILLMTEPQIPTPLPRITASPLQHARESFPH